MLKEKARKQEQEKGKKAIKIKKEVVVTTEDGKRVSLKPSNRIVYDFEIKFNHPAIGQQKFHFDYSIEEYKESIAKARTFGFLHEVQYLRSIGLALGGSMENAIVLDETKILNPEGLRYEDEFVRHKILDAIGDMALLEYTMIGEYEAVAGSHHLNHLLTKKLYEDKDNYEIIDLEEASSEAEVFELAFAKQLSAE